MFFICGQGKGVADCVHLNHNTFIIREIRPINFFRMPSRLTKIFGINSAIAADILYSVYQGLNNLQSDFRPFLRRVAITMTMNALLTLDADLSISKGRYLFEFKMVFHGKWGSRRGCGKIFCTIRMNKEVILLLLFGVR